MVATYNFGSVYECEIKFSFLVFKEHMLWVF